MANSPGTLRRFFSGILRIYRIFRSTILNLLFLFLFFSVLAAMMSTPIVIVPNGAALVIAPQGSIVEEESYIDPLDSLMTGSLGASTGTQILLHDVISAIEIAAKDSAINALVLQLAAMQGTGFSKLQDIGAAITQFKNSGKKVYAVADSYTQGQYYLASYADEVMLNPLGEVDLQGFSSYQTYYGSAIEKLGINMHVFRVGEYKSAVEPYERDDMSPAAKAASSEWLGNLWRIFVSDISRERNLNASFIDDIIATLDQQLANHAGDTAQLALQIGLVDSVNDRTDTRNHLISEIGFDMLTQSFKQIDSSAYLQARENPEPQVPDKVGLIIASGTIYDGVQRAGNIGGDSLARLIRQAREDENIKALVLRIDSGGGSAFASEIIRSELLKLKAAGKPLIASMGSTAASGGYWIASPADQIWASASTITGSIGIYSIYPTFENTLKSLGIYTDGVGTTALAGAFTVGRDLPPIVSNALQLSLENGYNRFLNIVAQGRNMTTIEVDNIAQGRVWSGETALENGLVDHLGNLDQAIAAAAELAQLDSYNTILIKAPLSPGELFLKSLSENVTLKNFIGTETSAPSLNNSVLNFYQKINADVQQLLQFNDPKGMYLQCLECAIN